MRRHGKGLRGEIVYPDPGGRSGTGCSTPPDAAGGHGPSRSIRPTRRGRAGDFAAASNSRQPRRRPSLSRTNQRRCGPNGRGQPRPWWPVDQLVPVGDIPLLRRRLERQRLQLGQGAIDRGPGVGNAGCGRSTWGPPGIVFRLAGRVRTPHSSSLSSHAQAGRDPVTALRGGPVQVLADRLGEFVAAQGRAQRHRLLDVGDLAPGQATPAKCGGFESLDPRIHRPRPPLTVLPERKVPWAVRFCQPGFVRVSQSYESGLESAGWKPRQNLRKKPPTNKMSLLGRRAGPGAGAGPVRCLRDGARLRRHSQDDVRFR